MKIGFYTFGDHQMGLGHVFRCLALERALRRNWPKAEFVYELKPGAEGARVVGERKGAKVNRLKAGQRPAGPWDILIVDQFGVSPAEMCALKKGATRLISLDDPGSGCFEADISFNALYENQAERPKGSKTRCFEGLEYVFIDESFARQSYAVKDEVRDVLLSQGGADTYGMLPDLAAQAALALKDYPGVTLHALVGPAFRHDRKLKEAAAEAAVEVRCHRGVCDMPALLAGMDLAVSAAGLTACELAAVGVPAVLVTGETKELETSKKLAELGCAFDAGNSVPSSISYLRLLAHDKKVRQSMSARARKAVDGRGLERVCGILEGALA
ncbi:MAG: hypothetical protein HY077_13465 [Elusimicrobia bacterium]|nr:hypothetical protein [Elusimicrobiota bacterium]